MPSFPIEENINELFPRNEEKHAVFAAMPPRFLNILSTVMRSLMFSLLSRLMVKSKLVYPTKAEGFN
jgi:hypothetical protein